MPVKCEINTPQLELEVRHQNGTTYPVEFQVGVQLHYENRYGQLYLGDSLAWLKEMKSETVDLVFADPPYNIKKADWDNFEILVKFSHEYSACTSRSAA